MFKKTITIFSILIIIIGCIFLVNGLILAWSIPGSTPPAGNVSPPINTGSSNQTKNAGLSLDGSTYGLWADGTSYGVFGQDSDGGAYGYLGVSNNYGGYFIGKYGAYVYDSDHGTSAYLAHEGYGIYSNGVIRGSYFMDNDSTGYVVDPAGNTNLSGLTVSGNVGIGTAAPSYKIHAVTNSPSWGFLFQNTAGTNNYTYMNHGTYGVHIRNDSTPAGNYLLDVYPSNGKRFQVLGDGTVVALGTLNIGSYGDIYSDASWLRLNQNHTQNIYTPRIMRADGGFQVDGNTVIDDGAGWHRTYGATGWYNGTYGGGWYMADTSWIRAYNNKGVYTPGEMQAGTIRGNSYVCISSDCRTTWPSGGITVETDTLDTVAWRGNTTSNWIQSNSSMRAPLFYDSNNTGFYVDPAGTSYLSGINTSGIYSGGYINTVLLYAGTASISGYISAPGFGDYNNPSYYLDPNGTSYLNVVYAYSPITSPMFIDYNNGNYYVNPYGTSVFDWITTRGYTIGSDISLKKDIQKLDNSLDKVLKLEGISFKWKDEEHGIGDNLGLIAQDVEKIFPEVVTTNENNGLKGIQYSNLIAPVIEAIKELAGKVEDLFNKYINQQKQIDTLEKRIEELEKINNVN